MKQNPAPKWCPGCEQTFPLMLWDSKSFFRAEEVPQDSSKLVFLPPAPRRKGAAHPCRATPRLPYGTPLTRAAQQHRHLNSEALRPLHGQLWKNINYKSSTSWPFCLFRPPASSEWWTTPAVLPASPKCPHAHPQHLIQERAVSDVSSELPASRDLISPLMEEQICAPDTGNHLVFALPATSSASASLDTGYQEMKCIHIFQAQEGASKSEQGNHSG